MFFVLRVACCLCRDDLARAQPTKARVIAKATVDKLIQDEAGNVVGVEYVQGGQRFKEYGPVIISTGGFCADFGADSLLAKYRPDLLALPTTNGQLRRTRAIGIVRVALDAL